MFGKLKEKFSGWLKKKPTEPESKKSKEKILKEEAGKIDKEVPLKFKSDLQKFEPNLDKIQEEIVEESGFFSKLRNRLTTSVLTQEQFDEAFEELEIVLLENNVALVVVDKIHDSLSKNLVGVSVKKGDVEETIVGNLKNSILDVLVEGDDLISLVKNSLDCYVVLFFGINGSGKTTSVAKLAWALKMAGVSCVIGAADTFRAAAVEQLEKHANNIGVPIVKGNYGTDSASVAFDTIAYAKSHNIKVALIDTAGRMYTQGNLMREMEKIVKIAKPNLKIFVGESITGNDAIEQAKSFNDSVGIDGVILSKADIDEKAGTILSVSAVTGKPILYLGVGQEYKDLEKFTKARVLKGLGLE